MIAALTGRSYALLSVRIRSRGGTAFFLDKCFGTAIGGPLNVLLWLSYFVMLGLYAVAFGSYGAAFLGFSDPGGPLGRVLASGVVLAFVQGDQCFACPLSVDGCSCLRRRVDLGYEGFELMANAAEDAKDPRHGVPLAYVISIGVVIALYVLVAFVAVGNLSVAQIDHDRDYALAAAARRPGLFGVRLDRDRRGDFHRERHQRDTLRHSEIHLLDGPQRRTPARPEPARLDRPIGGLLVTTAGTLVVINAVDIEGISLMGSAGFLLIFTAVNLAVLRFRVGKTTELVAVRARWPAWVPSGRSRLTAPPGCLASCGFWADSCWARCWGKAWSGFADEK